MDITHETKQNHPTTKSHTLVRDFINQISDYSKVNHAEIPFYHTLFLTLIENAPVGIYVLEDGALSYVNSHYSKLLGYNIEELTQGTVPVNRIIHPEDFPVLQSQLEKRMSGEETEARYKIRKLKKDGSLIYTEVHASTAYFNGKTVLFGSVIDITEQVVAQQQLEESNARYKSLFINSPDAIFSFDDQGKFSSVNPASEQITGFSIDELLKMSFAPLIIPEDLPKAIKHFEDAKAGMASTGDLAITRKDGEIVHINATHFPMHENGKVVGSFGIARDITHKILYDQQMQKFAYYDSLTQLPNRKLFEQRVEQVIHSSREKQQEFAVLFIDLDRFKYINDSLGHDFGDEYLKMLSDRLKGCLRNTDTVSRLAGDEFTILLPETSKDEVIELVERISQMLMDPFVVSGHSVIISASIGVALSNGVEHSVQELLRNADTAMYYTKRFRKSSYIIYSEEMDLESSYKIMIQRDLRFAIQNDEFELHYQPIMNLKTEQMTVMEALIRWNHPQLGLVSPSDFISVAEDSGQIVHIGKWVLQTACRQVKLWQDSGIPPFKIAVNISTKQLQHHNFVESVLNILDEAKLEPKWLELEVTESVLLDDVDLIKECLIKLKQAGICISIDDFGTGYSSLSYLGEYPFDKVKIARRFIDDISRDLSGKRISSAIISLAHNLNINVVAEGIENELQLKFLIDESCDEGQGYLLSRPMPAHLLPIAPK